MSQASDWRSVLQTVLSLRWPSMSDQWQLFEAQIRAESAGNPKAESPVGAIGLMQLMPATATELNVLNPWDPGQNIDGGVRYDRLQYEHLEEIPRHEDRLRWMLASYNGGRGYVNKALSLARRDGQPDWWRWDVGRWYLHHRDCMIGSRFPDYRQMWDYVDRIERFRQAVV